MSLKEIYHNKWVRLGFWSVLYILWVIWLGNYWWILGLIPIFDQHITKKVKWLFWKKDYKEGEKRNVILDWVDAIIFAVIVVTFINTFFFQAFKIPSPSMESTLYTGDHLFVSKLAYGPKMPQTPLTIPFTHNVIGGKESYSTLIKRDYRRLKGFGEVKTGDCVVFGFPHGDTVLTQFPTSDYYELARYEEKSGGSREAILRNFDYKVRPVDKKDHYVKRCVAVAGDSLHVKDARIYVNGNALEVWPGVQNTYTVITKGQMIPSSALYDMGITPAGLSYDPTLPGYRNMPLTSEMLARISKSPYVAVPPVLNIEEYDPRLEIYIFPFSQDYKWTRDNFGPIWIPEQGATVELTIENLPLYSRIIDVYEGNSLNVKDGVIYINGKEAQSYTFKQDYYFMMGDNRHNSLDSRYWGFVPEDHIVGRPAVIWLSIDRNEKFPKNIRWRRFFKFL